MKFVLGFALVLVIAPLGFLGWTAYGVWHASQQDQRPVSDAIVVMGAAQYDGEPSPVFKSRLDHAHRLYEADVAPLIVVLGGKREGDRFTEAQAGAAYLARTLPAASVAEVQAGNNTLESLQEFRLLADQRQIARIVIVSDPLHLGRAQAMARDLDFEAAISASSIPESSQAKRAGLIRETLNLSFYRVFGVS